MTQEARLPCFSNQTLFVMKGIFKISASFITLALLVISFNPPKNEEQHISIDDFPKNMIINHLDDWGGMAVAVNAMPAGTDLGPLLKGLKHDSCQVPHWGYILEGVLNVKYEDNEAVTLKKGDLFYMPPGHTGMVVEDLKLLDFSPDKGFNHVVDHIEKKVAEMNN